MTTARVIVIGGGASGTLLAAELLRQPTPTEVVIVEAREELGRGVAYSTESAVHLLNVRAGRMSGRAADGDHFLRWLQQETARATEGSFVPRRLYGRYLQATLDEARLERSPGSSLRHLVGEATSLERDDSGWRVALAGGGSIAAPVVVLAIGVGAPSGFPAPIPADADRERFVADPWQRGALDVPPDEDVLLIGTGLTAMDVALGLRERGHRGRINVVSRRGLVPRTQAASQPPLFPAVPGGGPPRALAPLSTGARVFGDPLVRASLNRLTRAFRSEVRRVVAAGGDWHELFEVTRPLTVALWAGLSWAHRRRFLRHLQPYWDVHRHRMAQAVGDALGELRRSGVLQLRAARVLGFAAAQRGVLVTLAPRGRSERVSLTVGRVIACTGSGPLVTSRMPLIENVVQSGFARFDPLGLGLDALADGRLLAASGQPAGGLFALGPVLKGVRWETTAVPEIRVQAATLARRVVTPLLDPASERAPDARFASA